jgi:hypothetical protein
MGLRAIRRIVANPCDTPFTVYLELGKEPAKNLIIGLLSFGMADLIRAYFRPRGLRSGRHMGRGRKGRRRGGGIPDSAELVAKLIPGYGAAKGRRVGDGVKFLWIIDTKVQAGLYYLLIYNLTKDFLSDWGTNIIEFEAENCDKQSAYLAYGPGGANFPGGGGLFFNNTQYVRGPATTGLNSYNPGFNGVTQAVVTNTVRSPPTALSTFNIRLGLTVGGQTDWGGWVAVPPGKTVSMVHARTYNGAQTVSTSFEATGVGTIQAVSGEFFCISF